MDPPVAHAADANTYSWGNANPLSESTDDYGYATCPSDDIGCKNYPNLRYTLNGVTYGEADPWGYGLRNCTSYVAEKISQEFNGRNVSGWGDAANWAAAAQKAGYTLDSGPADGDIAVWGTEVASGYGHVAYVGSVANGVATFDEYNVHETGQFTDNYTSANHPGGKAAPDWYIHMGTPADGEGSTPPPPPPAPPAPNDTLYFIKTQDTGSGTIEIHDAISAGAYQTADLHTATYFNEVDGPNGTWQVWHKNLYFIKTQNTAGTIEVHDATAASNYQAADVHSTSPFSELDAGNGEWQMADINHDNIPDLVFIKERNTISGHVEVFVSYGPGYSKIDIGDTTAFSPTDATNGYFQIENADLYYIKTQNTGTNSVELFRAPIGENYMLITESTGTLFSMTDPTNGKFSLEDMYNSGSPELVYTKTQNTDKGVVEIFAANGPNPQQLVLATTTYFGEDNGPNGTWEIGDGS